MRRTVAEIQTCKPGLCLPDNAEETLTVFTVVDQLQALLLELEKVGRPPRSSSSLLSLLFTDLCALTLLAEGSGVLHPAASDSRPGQASGVGPSASRPQTCRGGRGESQLKERRMVQWRCHSPEVFIQL